MHVTSSLQIITIQSAVEAGLSKCTTLQMLTVWGSPPSVSAAVLKAVIVIRSLEEVTLDYCVFGMCCVCQSVTHQQMRSLLHMMLTEVCQ